MTPGASVINHQQLGEGRYEQAEQLIQQLLARAGGGPTLSAETLANF